MGADGEGVALAVVNLWLNRSVKLRLRWATAVHESQRQEWHLTSNLKDTAIHLNGAKLGFRGGGSRQMPSIPDLAPRYLPTGSYTSVAQSSIVFAVQRGLPCDAQPVI